MESEYAHIINRYAEEVSALYATGATTEHSFRGAMERMLRGLMERFEVVNEPKRSECGAPDFALMGREDGLPYAYIEAKDLFDVDLRGTNAKGHKEQFDRYKNGLARVAFTDYLEFVFYVDGVETDAVRLLKSDGKGGFCADEGERFVSVIAKWADCGVQGIGNATRLAEVMAHKARLLAEAFEKILAYEEWSEVHSKYNSFKSALIADLAEKEFADIYAQTIVYGMFAARLNDKDGSTFTRHKAAMLIPMTNPFLRKIFQDIAGYDLDGRIAWIVDDLSDAFAATDVDKVMGYYSQNALHSDSLIHFYEDFLAEYDPALRKSCGVYYTPRPVVEFIVRIIDNILVRDLGIKDGLADETMVEYDVTNPQTNKKVKELCHRVQILDPATGTGTFLAETVRLIYSKFKGDKKAWRKYVDESLRPRLRGFELLMAPYTITHLKLDMMYRNGGEMETGDEEEVVEAPTAVSPQQMNTKRTQVYLTNSLEESHFIPKNLFDYWISMEGEQANAIKRDCPVMVMMGNPPYSVSSTNKGAWIMQLMEDYKRDLNEVNIKPLNDDYIKFIRLGQNYIERNKIGVHGVITNNSYLDGIIHRQMRKTLLTIYNDIYIVNLHGNSKRKETTPDGKKDENVFDIMVGTSIAVFVKKKKSKRDAKVHYIDLWGLRKAKFEALDSYTLENAPWQTLECKAPNYFFVPMDFTQEEEYKKGIKIDELFKVYSTGVKTGCDDASVFIDSETKKTVYNDFCRMKVEEIRDKYGFEDVRDWRVEEAKNDITKNKVLAEKILYRPFDVRHCIYTGKTIGIMSYPRYGVMQHLLKGNNKGLIIPRTNKERLCVFVSDKVTGHKACNNYDINNFFPLYLYGDRRKKEINMDWELVEKALANIGEAQKNGKEKVAEDFFAYIYAVLHSPSYREKYREFLKIDFPRVPIPEDGTEYKRLVRLGKKLISLHLMEREAVDKLQSGVIPKFSNTDGSDKVENMRYEDGKVWINETQYFDGVSEDAWKFYVGGYQPAQKWLKDRKGRELGRAEMKEYEEIVGVIGETMKVMEEIG